MSQVNPIPKSNGISDEEEITAGRSDGGMDRDPLELGPVHTMQDTTFTASIKCVFIIDSLIGTKAWHWKGCHLCLFVLYTDEAIPSRMPGLTLESKLKDTGGRDRTTHTQS